MSFYLRFFYLFLISLSFSAKALFFEIEYKWLHQNDKGEIITDNEPNASGEQFILIPATKEVMSQLEGPLNGKKTVEGTILSIEKVNGPKGEITYKKILVRSVEDYNRPLF